jgi:hypothetical protein
MKSLIAFAIACFAVALACIMFGAVLRLAAPMSNLLQSTNVEVRSSGDTSSTVAAINGLNLPHVHVHGHTTALTVSTLFVMTFELAVSLFISSGIVLVIFKRLCRQMGIEPII